MARPSSLTVPAGDLILTALRHSKKPLTAYALLKKLKKNGINSAPIIYRALAGLLRNGTVHKIKEMGAYIACNCTPDHAHSVSVLTVCGACHQVQELHDHSVIRKLESLRQCGITLQDKAVIELPITCQKCVV